MAIKITNATEKVLDVLQEGRATPGYIQRETDLARNTVHGQINQLLAADAVVYIDEPTGLYELVEDPRGEDVSDSGDRSMIEAVCGDLERALEDREWSAVEDAATRLECDLK
ncbi:hypothetical protein [Saliphagus sp. LR7]|uniref:hypothetical protein n=1 Tax=Saliphagus sp. LR7 TaxID=2282654 RepID=UPI001300BE79|nr:hypothetical protein [Saliphagus sp. LR7]